MVMNLCFMGGGKYAGLLYALFSPHNRVVGYFDDLFPDAYVNRMYGLKYLGKSTDARSLLPDCSNAVIAIGSEGDLSIRGRYFSMFKAAGFEFPCLVHPSAIVGPNSMIGHGTVVQYNALIHPGVHIGENCVISSGAIIGHDADIGNNVYIAPGVVINGSVEIGNDTFCGSGSIVIQKQIVGKRCLIAAAACVVSEVPEDSVVMGVPGKAQPRRTPQPE
jgi:sugar O-acyltransferase (sialic acid O-acetyltransferase NeuD family)